MSQICNEINLKLSDLAVILKHSFMDLIPFGPYSLSSTSYPYHLGYCSTLRWLSKKLFPIQEIFECLRCSVPIFRNQIVCLFVPAKADPAKGPWAMHMHMRPCPLAMPLSTSQQVRRGMRGRSAFQKQTPFMLSDWPLFSPQPYLLQGILILK